MGGKRFADEPKDFGEEREINYKKVAHIFEFFLLCVYIRAQTF